jgi:hypothetical protein
MRVLAISLAISARVARMRPLPLDFFWFMAASWHESSAQERSIQTILRITAAPAGHPNSYGTAKGSREMGPFCMLDEKTISMGYVEHGCGRIHGPFRTRGWSK